VLNTNATMLNPSIHVILGLGSNLGDRLQHLRVAVAALLAAPHVSVVNQSPIYETPPWGAAGSPAFLNAAVLVKASLPLDAVLGLCLGIESALGRRRDTQDQFAPRVIDIDVLFAGDAASQAPHLYVPHPRLHLRAFALKPAYDVWPHPQLAQWLSTPTVQADLPHVRATAHSLF
jgi:2-amino-4-hydroxy-6-hydroxymethyldihydropteridine diphosphokinase